MKAGSRANIDLPSEDVFKHQLQPCEFQKTESAVRILIKKKIHIRIGARIVSGMRAIQIKGADAQIPYGRFLTHQSVNDFSLSHSSNLQEVFSRVDACWGFHS